MEKNQTAIDTRKGNYKHDGQEEETQETNQRILDFHSDPDYRQERHQGQNYPQVSRREQKMKLLHKLIATCYYCGGKVVKADGGWVCQDCGRYQ